MQSVGNMAGGGMPNMTGSVPGLIPVPKKTSSTPLNFQNLPQSGLGMSMSASGAGKNSFSNSGAGMNTGGIIAPPSNPSNSGTVNSGTGNINQNNGSSASPYAMTADEASGGAAGLATYQARIKGMGGSTNGDGTNGGDNSQINPNPGIAPLSTMASSPSTGFTQAQNEYNQAAQELQQSKMNEAGQQVANANMPIPLNFMAGRNSTIQGEATAQQQAEAGTMQAAAAQEAAQTGQQGTQQSGLASVANLEAPVPGQTANTTSFNPSAGTYGTPAYSAYGAGGSNGLQTAGAVTNEMSVGATGDAMEHNLGTAQATGSNLQQLITDNHINPSDINLVNGVLQFGANQMSNPAYAKFAGQLNNYISAIAQVLGRGNPTTNMTTGLAQQLVNMTSKGSTMNDVINYFNSQAQNDISGYLGGAGSGAGTSSGSSNTGGTQTTFTSGGFFGSQ